jgi:hypothetical protein
VLAIPLVYTQSGWLPTLISVTFFLLVSSLASTCVAQAVASIPDNREYEQRVEFGTAVQYFYGDRWHSLFQVALNITIASYLIASVVICAQSVDQAIVTIAGQTYAFEFVPQFGFHAFSNVDLLYSSDHITISLGYIIVLACFMPAGFLNLNDNVKTVQVASFVFMVALMAEFVAFFSWRGHKFGWHSIPPVGHTYPQLVSVFIFSWAYVIFVPSWLNEKEVGVSVNKVIWSSGVASWGGYVAIGWLCFASFGHETKKLDNVLVALTGADMPVITRVAAHLFSLGVIAPGIPVCSVTCRYNLFVGGVCSKRWSYFWGCVAPWIVGFVFCQGEIFANLLNWTSLVFNGFVNFVVPFLLYLAALKLQQIGGAPKIDHLISRARARGASATTATHDGDEFDITVGPQVLISPDSLLPGDAAVAATIAPATNSIQQQPHQSSLKMPLLPEDHLAASLNGSMISRDSFDGSTAASPSEFVDVTSEDYLHGPVYPYPKMLRPYAYQITLAVALVTFGVIFAQTVGDIVFAAQGGDALG